MAKVPLKWKKVGSVGKVEINGDSDSTFASDAPALKVNGDIASNNLTTITSRIDTIEGVLPSLLGVVNATVPMTISSGKPSAVHSGDGKLYSNGVGFPDVGTYVRAVWFRVNTNPNNDRPDAEIGMGTKSGVLYLRHYDNTNSVVKEATLFDENGNATFPSTISAVTFSGNLNGTASAATVASRAEKLGSLNVGSASIPIYINGGTPAACGSQLNGTISSIGLSRTVNYSVVGGSAVSSPCTNVNATYAYEKTNGVWNKGTVSAKRVANVVHISLSIKGTGSSARFGDAGFVGSITAGTNAALPAEPVNLFAYYGSFPIICSISTSGVVNFIPLGNSETIAGSMTIPNNTEVTASGTFICVP